MEIDPPTPPAQEGEGAQAAAAAADNGGAVVVAADADAMTMTAEETALQCINDHDLRVAYYCEENVWRLTYRMRHLHDDENNGVARNFWVVFISNAIKNVPMFYQRACQDPNKSVCWDYHVILIGSNTNTTNSCSVSSSAATATMQHHHHDDSNDDNAGSTTNMMVYDIDSRLPYPCPLQQYLQQSFPYEWPEPYNPMFRVIPADLFLQHFSSDRSHMINRQTGEWNAPPPPYAPITGDGSGEGTGNNTNNLQHYLNFVGRPQHHHRTEMDENALGQIWNKQQLAMAEFARDY